jgi:hypothetical protein
MRPNAEMTLDELLSDLLIGKLMASDGVDARTIRKTAREIRRRVLSDSKRMPVERRRPRQGVAPAIRRLSHST